jgi:hypothetical protein
VSNLWQKDANFYTLVEWNGNDKSELLNACHDLRAAILYLKKQHLTVKCMGDAQPRRMKVRFWFGADMKAMWSWFNIHWWCS